MKDFQDCKVLLVDDTVPNIDILVATLGEEMEVIVATDGESALEAVAWEKPDLILLDIEMPGMDGYEVLRRLKAAPLTASIPVVFLSARGGAPEKVKGLAMGAVEYIAKPFVTAMVLDTVKRILSRRNPDGMEGAP